MRVSSRSYQFRMALNTWHVWQYVIGIDITLSLAECTRHFFTVAVPKRQLKGLSQPATAPSIFGRKSCATCLMLGLTVASAHESQMKPR